MASSERIRVLIVLNSLGMGGEEMQVLRLAPAFDRTRFEVTVACTSTRGMELHGAFLRAGVTPLVLDRAKLGPLGFLRAATAWMREHRIQVVHAFAGTANFHARLAALLAGVPVILGGMRGQRSVEGPLGILYRMLNVRSAGWIVNSDALVPILRRRMGPGLPIHVVRNGLPDRPVPAVEAADPGGYGTLRGGARVVGAVGRLAPVKQFPVFCEMAARILAVRQDVVFWILGEGPLRATLEAWIRERGLQGRILLLGRRDDVDHALSQMDVLVMTSRTEGCPNALLEGLRAGVPLVATACTDLGGIIEEGRNGSVRPVGDAQGLAEAVLAILDLPPERREDLGAHSRRLFETHFTLDRAVRGFQDIYARCLAEVGPPVPAGQPLQAGGAHAHQDD